MNSAENRYLPKKLLLTLERESYHNKNKFYGRRVGNPPAPWMGWVYPWQSRWSVNQATRSTANIFIWASFSRTRSCAEPAALDATTRCLSAFANVGTINLRVYLNSKAIFHKLRIKMHNAEILIKQNYDYWNLNDFQMSSADGQQRTTSSRSSPITGRDTSPDFITLILQLWFNAPVDDAMIVMK